MKQAYCSECRGYIVLDDAGMCPGGHARPCYRDVREIDSVPVSTPSKPAVMLTAQTAAAWGGRPYERRPNQSRMMAMAAVFYSVMVVGSIIFFRLQTISLWSFGPGIIWAVAAQRAAQHPYAIVSPTGIVVWQSPWQPVILEWRDVVRCRRAGRLTRIDTRAGKVVDLYLDGMRPDRVQEFSAELGGYLGPLWAGATADDPELTRSLRARDLRIALLLLAVVLVLGAVAAAEYWAIPRGLFGK